jgi:acetyltransferase-like isoleucine patch superfamily enzyme
MKITFVIIYKVIRRILLTFYSFYCYCLTWIKLQGNGVEFSSLSSNGVPMIDVEMGGVLHFGKNFRMNNGKYYNKIGRQQASMFIVTKNGSVTFGDNVGVSSSAFFCTLKIEIGNNVKIGGNCVFYDTDFHSLNFLDRRDDKTDKLNNKSAPLIIKDDVFIGSHCTVLKGITIGERSIIGAGSVVCKSIPPDEIWGGDPIVFIKSNKYD